MAKRPKATSSHHNSELPESLVKGIAEHAAARIFHATDPDGCSIAIVEASDNRCTIIVTDPEGSSSTVLLPLGDLARMSDALSRYFQRRAPLL